MSDEESHEGSLGLQELFPVRCLLFTFSLFIQNHIQEAERPPTPEPKFSEYLREHNAQEPDWTSITVRLVGSHPLWAHYLSVCYPNPFRRVNHVHRPVDGTQAAP